MKISFLRTERRTWACLKLEKKTPIDRKMLENERKLGEQVSVGGKRSMGG